MIIGRPDGTRVTAIVNIRLLRNERGAVNRDLTSMNSNFAGKQKPGTMTLSGANGSGR